MAFEEIDHQNFTQQIEQYAGMAVLLYTDCLPNINSLNLVQQANASKVALFCETHSPIEDVKFCICDAKNDRVLADMKLIHELPTTVLYFEGTEEDREKGLILPTNMMAWFNRYRLSKVKKITGANFTSEVANSGKYYVLIYHDGLTSIGSPSHIQLANHTLSALYYEAYLGYGGIPGIYFGTNDPTDRNEALLIQNIHELPTTVLYNRTEVDRREGIISPEEMKAWIEKFRPLVGIL